MAATGIVQTFWITVPIFLVGGIAEGLLQPVRRTYLHNSIPTSERATLVSFDSLMGNLGSVGTQTGLGYLSQERSLPVAFVVGGLTMGLAVPFYTRLRSLDRPADHISDDEDEAATNDPVPADTHPAATTT